MSFSLSLIDGGFISEEYICDGDFDYKIPVRHDVLTYTNHEGQTFALSGYHQGYFMYRVNCRQYYLGRGDGLCRLVYGPPISRILEWKFHGTHLRWRTDPSRNHWRSFVGETVYHHNRNGTRTYGDLFKNGYIEKIAFHCGVVLRERTGMCFD